MKRFIIIAAAIATLAPLSAHAQERMSDGRYAAAQRCLAYGDLRQLQSDPIDFTALREAVDVGTREYWLVSDAREYARGLRARAGGASIEHLRRSRDEACQGFVEQGLVQSGETNTGAS